MRWTPATQHAGRKIHLGRIDQRFTGPAAEVVTAVSGYTVWRLHRAAHVRMVHPCLQPKLQRFERIALRKLYCEMEDAAFPTCVRLPLNHSLPSQHVVANWHGTDPWRCVSGEVDELLRTVDSHTKRVRIATRADSNAPRPTGAHLAKTLDDRILLWRFHRLLCLIVGVVAALDNHQSVLRKDGQI